MPTHLTFMATVGGPDDLDVSGGLFCSVVAVAALPVLIQQPKRPSEASTLFFLNKKI